MPFPHSVKEESLVRSRRCCCVCNEFAGLYTNVHHIVRESDGGPNNLDNAIVLCLRCHGEAGRYDPKHAIGNKYSSNELRRHRDEWWKWCENNPAVSLPKYPISVSPGVISLWVGQWKAHSLFKVYSKTDEMYYQIWIKLTIHSPQVYTQDINIDLTKPKEELSMPVGPVTVSGDIIRINCTDQAGNEVIFIVLSNLDPREVRTFILTNNSSYIPPISAQHEVLIGVSDFAKQPAETLVQPGTMALTIKPPETINLKSIGFLMKRS